MSCKVPVQLLLYSSNSGKCNQCLFEFSSPSNSLLNKHTHKKKIPFHFHLATPLICQAPPLEWLWPQPYSGALRCEDRVRNVRSIQGNMNCYFPTSMKKQRLQWWNLSDAVSQWDGCCTFGIWTGAQVRVFLKQQSQGLKILAGTVQVRELLQRLKPDE